MNVKKKKHRVYVVLFELLSRLIENILKEFLLQI